jgi:type IV secretion system protein VirB10
MIEMGSPTADPLGRAGLRGAVNTHFFQRFAGTVLQSALQIGSELATRRVSQDTVYIGLPSAVPGLVITPDKIQPTITVKQGTSLSVFVARDLDFTSVE